MMTAQHLAEMKATLEKLQGVPKEWVLIDPQGKVYVGQPLDIAPVLLQHHPLLQLPGIRDIKMEA